MHNPTQGPVATPMGFQATARPSSNPRSSEAGNFDSTDGNTQNCVSGMARLALHPSPAATLASST